MVCPPPQLTPTNSYAELLTPKALVLVGGLWVVVRSGGCILVSGTSAIMKETPELHDPFQHVRTQQKTAIREPGSRSLSNTKSAGAMTSDFTNSRAVLSVRLLFISHPVALG